MRQTFKIGYDYDLQITHDYETTLYLRKIFPYSPMNKRIYRGVLERTIQYLNETYPEQFTIADAKRGDIGNTSTRYAKAFFEAMEFDSITVAPYMGKDSVEQFLPLSTIYHQLGVGLAQSQQQKACFGIFHTKDDNNQKLL